MYFNYTILFAQFIISYNKIYEDSEFFNKYNIFKNNYDQIQFFNSQNNTYKLGINEYADLTQDEWNNKLNAFGFNTDNSCPDYEFKNIETPDSIDWRDAGIVPPIRDQGSCGSCWAFAITGATESTWIQTLDISGMNNLTEFYLSPQQLIDCSSDYGNAGCSGGYIDYTFRYIIDNGICLDSDYQYIAESNELCLECRTVVKLTNCYEIPEGNQLVLKEAVSIRPVVIGVEADNFVFQFYQSGIITGSDCGTSMNHAILIIGYGEDEETNIKYWIVKNSWGTSWGEDGYVRIERSEWEDDIGVCGIALEPVMAEI